MVSGHLQVKKGFYYVVCGNCYNYEYDGYVFVDELGDLMRPEYLTSYFPQYIQKHGCKRMRFHDLRHPYVKHTTKKYNSEKQKTQATKMNLIAWVFRFCTFNYSKRSWTL